MNKEARESLQIFYKSQLCQHIDMVVITASDPNQADDKIDFNGFVQTLKDFLNLQNKRNNAKLVKYFT